MSYQAETRPGLLDFYSNTYSVLFKQAEVLVTLLDPGHLDRLKDAFTTVFGVIIE
jgi:hypothetical protein